VAEGNSSVFEHRRYRLDELEPRASHQPRQLVFRERLLSEDLADRGGGVTQSDLGHRDITQTVRYTELAPQRFNYFWRD
jgi:hypothetical protein